MTSIYELQASLKSSSTAYLMWFFLGAQYAYMGRWGLQLLYWFTFGGLGIWMFVDMFCIGSMVRRHNSKILDKIEDIAEKQHQKDLEKIVAMSK